MVRNLSLLAAVILFCTFLSNGQKTLHAVTIDGKIEIDGRLTEEAWSKAEPGSDFIQLKPFPGAKASRETKVRILYDREAIYVGAFCADQTDSVSKVLSLRDDINANLDYFGILLDTYNDDQNGFFFWVTSRGVQIDGKIIGESTDGNLNLVWQSAVGQTDNGWVVEFRIPYSAIRFPKTNVQSWGVNFIRQISRFREEVYWNPVSPDFNNTIAQAGNLTGIESIEPPVRLALIPYVSGYLDRVPSPENNTTGLTRSFNGGMDIKYGVNEAFTLDMTLVPDFGQVVFDNQVLNLSPFEIQFNENRQFFTEGTELFNKSGLFYSRRVGVQAPFSVLQTLLKDNEYLKNVPGSTQLYNASKFSGRMSNGLGLGVFNGITAPQYATAVNLSSGEEREILASPITNYSVLVADQNLKNNSFVSLTNTNVWRAGEFYDANVSGLNFSLNTADNAYSLSGSSAISVKTGMEDGQGYNWGLSAAKKRGAFAGSISYFEESDTYDPNDLGFNVVNNRKVVSTNLSYRIFDPKWSLMNRIITSLGGSYNRLFYPNVYTATYINGRSVFVTKNFDAAGIDLDGSITESYDYFEPRKEGSYFIRPIWMNIGGWISTNYQKRLAVDAGIEYIYVGRADWWEWNYRWSTRLRVTNTLFLIHEWNQSFQYNSEGYALPFAEPAELQNYIVFGNRNRTNTTNTLNINYTMTNTMGITFRMRHYSSNIRYNFFYQLLDNGRLDRTDYEGLSSDGTSAYDVNFNAFTIDLVYRWIFLPGSELSLVWKNSIFVTGNDPSADYINNIRSTFENSPANSLSLKVLYWIDYEQLKALRRGKKES